MSLSVNCRACGKSLRFSEELVGRRAKCPRCGETQVLHPPPPDERPVEAPVAEPLPPEEPPLADAGPFIEIRHRTTRRLLHRVYSDSLSGADLSGAKLVGADLSGAGPVLDEWVQKHSDSRAGNVPPTGAEPGALYGLLVLVVGPGVSFLLAAGSAMLLEMVPIRLFEVGTIIFGVCIPVTFITGLVLLVRGLARGNLTGGFGAKPPTRAELFATLLRQLSPLASGPFGAYLTTLTETEAEQLRLTVQATAPEEVARLVEGLNAAAKLNLAGANLEGADLREARLDGANLKAANLGMSGKVISQ